MTSPNNNEYPQFGNTPAEPAHLPQPMPGPQDYPQHSYAEQGYAQQPYAEQGNVYSGYTPTGYSPYNSGEQGYPQQPAALYGGYPQQGVVMQQPMQWGVPVPPKSKVAAALLCFFLGGLGVHDFYAGYIGRGVGKLALNFFGWVFLVFAFGGLLLTGLAVWILCDFVMIVAGAGWYTTDARGNLLQ